LFDWYRSHPEVLRLAAWQQLERGHLSELTKATAQASLEKIKSIRAAQRPDAVTGVIPPESLLVLILRLTTSQLDQARLNKKQGELLRLAMIEGVRRLVTP